MKIQSFIIALLAVASLHGQEKPADPYRETKAAPAVAAPDEAKNISICYETFSLPLAMAAKLQREQQIPQRDESSVVPIDGQIRDRIFQGQPILRTHSLRGDGPESKPGFFMSRFAVDALQTTDK
ncbi:MAG: hypothetical protein ABI162_09600 [Luteolibacter sp.]